MAEKIYLCSPNKHIELNKKWVHDLTAAGFKVKCACIDTPQTAAHGYTSDWLRSEIFRINTEFIEDCTIFVGILKDYGKDFGMETGFASALKKMMIGVDYNLDKNDVMVHQAFTFVLKPDELLPYLKEEE
jgi:nucleoside 2-deoxyribosyltransferase